MHSKNLLKKTAFRIVSIVIGMLCLTYASVPFYNLFCKVTGFGGTTQLAIDLPTVIHDREVIIQFDANTDSHLPWRFIPQQRQVSVKLGEEALAFYLTRNNSDESVSGMALYNVTPDKAGKYFNKVFCFCFEKQTLAPHEELIMPVSFFIDPEMANDPLLKDVHTITLSYTFFPFQN